MLLETLPMPASPAEIAAGEWVLNAPKFKQQMLTDLKAIGEVSLRKARRHSRLVMTDGRVLAATLLRECRKGGDDVGKPGHTSYLDFLKLVDGFSVWKPSNEPVWQIERERLNGKSRWTASHGLYESARNALGREIAVCLAVLHPRQFMLQGGLPKFLTGMASSFPGVEVVMTTDFPACFHTLKRSSIVSGLPLPRRVTKAALFDTKDRAVPLIRTPSGKLIPMSSSQATIVEVSSPGRGISMGAALSSVASEVVIKEILYAAETVPGVVAGSYGDNLFFLMKDATQKASLVEALTSVTIKHFGFDVIAELTRRISYQDPSKGFHLCGGIYTWRDGVLIRRTDPERIENYMIRAEINLGEATSVSAINGIADSLTGWTVQNRDTPNAVIQAIELAQLLGEERAYLVAKGAKKPGVYFNGKRWEKGSQAVNT